jgi:hypothetical protein
MKNFFIKCCYWSLFSPYRPYSREWDVEFMYMMNNNKFVPVFDYGDHISSYYAVLGPMELWIKNFPYGVFHPNDSKGQSTFSPLPSTIFYARKKLIKDFAEYMCINKPIPHMLKEDQLEVWVKHFKKTLFRP